mmetsp:Transcript_15499/g.34860  ORF Transcript_15499/g.34860 Transcript_15499/m.34860 type:complete len:171 (+) Transcript_15499:267-779(+)
MENVSPSEPPSESGTAGVASGPSSSPTASDTSVASNEHPKTKISDVNSHDTPDTSYEDASNCFGVWTLSYLTPLLQLGGKRPLQIDDVGQPSRADRADLAYARVGVMWEEMVKTKKEAVKRGEEPPGAFHDILLFDVIQQFAKEHISTALHLRRLRTRSFQRFAERLWTQ